MQTSAGDSTHGSPFDRTSIPHHVCTARTGSAASPTFRVATAGIAFAIAEVIEVATVIGQAIREIRKARREKRDQALIEQGRQEERERQKERLRDDDSPSKGGAAQKPRE